MLRTNLSTRPFYNDRAVRAGLALVALAALGLTIFNAVEIIRLERAGREARQTMAQNGEQAREARERAAVIRKSINQAALEAVRTSSRDANALIDRRAFSWTALLNYFQQTLPADVRVTSITPQIDDAGRMLVGIQLLARQAEDLNEFADALETTGAFSEVLALQQSVDDDGSWRASLQGYYSVPPAGAAVPAAGASEPAGGNASATTSASAAPRAATAGEGASR